MIALKQQLWREFEDLTFPEGQWSPSVAVGPSGDFLGEEDMSGTNVFNELEEVISYLSPWSVKPVVGLFGEVCVFAL